MRKTITLIALLLGPLLILPVFGVPEPSPARGTPQESLTRDWADDPIWFDGKAEIAEYEATRIIYGKDRRYTARIMTNKEHADPLTKTKSTDGTGRAVFKQHVREAVPTEKYTYHYSTMAYVGVDDFKSLKIDMGSQEDCGATYKQFVNHAAPGSPGQLSWRQFSYFPDEGHVSGSYGASDDLIFHDALTLVLRGYPFEETEIGKQIHFPMLPDQTTTKWSPAKPVETTLMFVGQEPLDLPYGKVQAYRLIFWPKADWQSKYPALPKGASTLWFAADPKLRHVLVQYEGADGTTYRLKSLTRDAYWVD